MKNIGYILLTAVILVSCDSFLDEKMRGDYSSETMYTTAEQAELAVNAIYNAAAYCTNLWKFGDVASDDSVKGGNAGDQADIGYFDSWTVDADNGVIAEFWQNTYETISRANNVISGLASSEIDEDTVEEYTAQAKFLRAFSYFQLVTIFGSVPLKLYPQVSESNVYVGLSSVEDIYAQIEDDLSAATVLPQTWSGTNAGRVTCGAAYGMLAKVHLYQKEYQEALDNIMWLKNLGIYELDEYENLFKLDESGKSNGFSPESVFAILFLSDQVPKLGNELNQWFAPSVESGYYFNAPTQNFVDCFDETQESGEIDPRLDISIGRDGMPWLNDNVFEADWSPDTGYLVKKHNQPLSEVSAGTKGDGGLAYIYLRYADILLMEAECYNELNNPTSAEIPLNLVRARVGLSPVSGLSQNDMRTQIRKERRKELSFEFHRFFDLMRWGEDAAKEALGSSFPWSDPQYYFPIPQSELDANYAIEQ